MGQRFPLAPEVSLLQNAFRSKVLFVTWAVAAGIFDCFSVRAARQGSRMVSVD